MAAHARPAMMLVAAVAAGCRLAVADAAAQPACGQYAWSRGHQADLFADHLPTFQNGDAMPKEGVFVMALRSSAEVFYPVRSGEGRYGGYGAIVTIENIAAGRYRIALSGPARVDAVQDYRLLPQALAARNPACPGEVLSVEVAAADGALTLQLSEATSPHLIIAVYRRWPDGWTW
ncbi:MAG: hypothetical protein KIT36_22605 [Alphaproteobacteria bacterium]|nr:hypothetical protein [Alphaproteobacteria bacterium]